MTRGIQVQPCRGVDCPCLGNPCSIGSDAFDRTNSLSIGPKWDQYTGGGEIDGNTLLFSTANERAIFVATHSDSNSAVIDADVTISNDDGAAVMFVDWDDDQNYVYATVVAGTSKTWTIKRKTAGVDSTLATGTLTIAAASAFDMRLCYAMGRLTLYVNGAVSLTAASASANVQRQVGVGTGPLAAGTVTFDDFTYRRGYDLDHNSCAGCSFGCVSGCPAFPTIIKLTVTGSVAGSSSPCVDCASFDGIFLLEYQGEFGGFGFPDGWWWISELISVCGGSWYYSLHIANDGSCHFSITANEYDGDFDLPFGETNFATMLGGFNLGPWDCSVFGPRVPSNGPFCKIGSFTLEAV
jgi:hypothetical protein